MSLLWLSRCPVYHHYCCTAAAHTQTRLRHPLCVIFLAAARHVRYLLWRPLLLPVRSPRRVGWTCGSLKLDSCSTLLDSPLYYINDSTRINSNLLKLRRLCLAQLDPSPRVVEVGQVHGEGVATNFSCERACILDALRYASVLSRLYTVDVQGPEASLITYLLFGAGGADLGRYPACRFSSGVRPTVVERVTTTNKRRAK